MERVNVYAETNTCTFKKIRRAAGYVLELVNEENDTVATVQGWSINESTWNEIILMTFISALTRLNRPCELHLYSQNKAVLDLIENNLESWKENRFRNSKGEPIRNAKLWEELATLCEGHLVITERGTHAYYHWMHYTLKREWTNSERSKNV